MTTTVVNTHFEQFDVYIGRGSPWGNPYRIGPKQDRATVILRYSIDLLKRTDLSDALHELKDKRLGCFCKPQACHGDVLAWLADAADDPARLQQRINRLSARIDDLLPF